MKFTKDEKEEFMGLVSDILALPHFQELKNERHHGITRYAHSMHVALLTYKLAKKDDSINLKDTVRAALMHDFFTSKDVGYAPSNKVLNIHPIVALENAEKYFELTPVQENIIISHMYPLSKIRPKFKEAWLVSRCDKQCATKEFFYNKVRRNTNDAYKLNIDNRLENGKLLKKVA